MEAWCLNAKIWKRKRGAASACHLQPYTLSDPGGMYLRTGTRPSSVRQLHTSIEPPTKEDVSRSRRDVQGSHAIWNNRAYPTCGWRDVAAVKFRSVKWYDKMKEGNPVGRQQPMAMPSAGMAMGRFLHVAGIDQNGWRAADGKYISWQHYEKFFLKKNGKPAKDCLIRGPRLALQRTERSLLITYSTMEIPIKTQR